MAFSKIILNGTTQIDLTQDTVVADKLYQNYTAHGADGLPVVGTATGGGGANLQSKSVSYTPTTSAQSETVTADSGYDGLSSVAVSVAAMPTGAVGTPVSVVGTVTNNSVTVKPVVVTQAGYIATERKEGTVTTIAASDLVSGTKSISANGTGIDVTNYAAVDVAVPGSSPSLQSKSITFNPSENAQSQTLTPDTGYDGLSQVTASVNALSSTYVGSGIPRRDYTDFVISGGTFTAPAGYYATDATDEIAYGTAGTPTATKGTVSNNAVTVTPSVTNTTGYITGGTKTGTAVTVRASELVSGTVYLDEPGSWNVANAETAVITGGTATPAASISATGATVSTGTNTLTLSKTVSNTPQVSAGYITAGTAGNSSVSLTATVTTQAAQTIYPSASDQTIASGRYLTGTQTIKAVTTTNLTAANIKKGVTVTVGDSADADRVASVTGTYEGGSSMNTQIWLGRAQRTANSYGATTATLTVAVTGTYTVSWTAWRSSSSGTMGTNLHVNSTTGTNQQTFTGTYGQNIQLTNQQYSAGDVLTIYATSGSNSRSIYVSNLIIEQTA